MRFFFTFFIVSICLSICLVGCKKDKFITDPSATVSFSQDSVLFDTVFTTIGSATRNIRVINNNNQKIKISSIRLEQGQTSPFFLNVDGTPGKEVHDVEILANDSIYIFIQVNVNPNNSLSPLIIQDKILFDVNGNQQTVQLEAWGQDAHYHFPNQAIQYQGGYLPYSTVSASTNTTVNWGGGTLGQPDDNRPHVIYGWLVVDSTQKLVINPGVKVYLHQNAGLWVYRYGTLQVKGVYGNEVVFQGDRREADYADLPGQWDRIWINEGSKDNYINYAIIKNSFIGVQASILANPNQPRHLKLTNTIIKNCSKWGLYTQFFSVWAANNVIANCKEYCAAVTLGGNYTFLQNTFANYFNQDGGRGGQPAVHIDNYDGTGAVWIDSMYFANNIIDGSIGTEFESDIRLSSNPSQVCKINNCFIKGASITNTLITSINNISSGNTDFNDIGAYDFKIKSTSIAKGMGDNSLISPLVNPIIIKDLDDKLRNTPLDAGAYNYLP